VIVDEIASSLNRLALPEAIGHRAQSLQESLGTQDYPRLRFGIGNDYPKGHQADYVLGKWKKDEEPLVKLKIDKSVEIIESFAAQGIALTMNQVNNQVYSL
jgi:PTH1 family peptidyl-tRNA hydrolase